MLQLNNTFGDVSIFEDVNLGGGRNPGVLSDLLRARGNSFNVRSNFNSDENIFSS